MPTRIRLKQVALIKGKLWESLHGLEKKLFIAYSYELGCELNDHFCYVEMVLSSTASNSRRSIDLLMSST